MSRFITVTGVAPGVGKTTLAFALANEIGLSRFLVEDDTVFDVDEFAEVATYFRRRSSPPPELLEAAYAAVALPMSASGTLLADWHVIDLAEDLDWAEASEPDLHAHARRVYTMFEPMLPVVVYLEADPMVGLQRRLAQRGRSWFERHGDNLGLTEVDWSARLEAMADLYGRRRDRVVRAMSAGGWPVLSVDAKAKPARVFADARARLADWSHAC